MKSAAAPVKRAALLNLSRKAHELARFIVDAQTGRYDMTYDEILKRVSSQAWGLAEEAKRL